MLHAVYNVQAYRLLPTAAPAITTGKDDPRQLTLARQVPVVATIPSIFWCWFNILKKWWLSRKPKTDVVSDPLAKYLHGVGDFGFSLRSGINTWPTIKDRSTLPSKPRAFFHWQINTASVSRPTHLFPLTCIPSFPVIVIIMTSYPVRCVLQQHWAF